MPERGNVVERVFAAVLLSLLCAGCSATAAGPVALPPDPSSALTSQAAGETPSETPSETPTETPSQASSPRPVVQPVAGSALAFLALLPVKGRAPKTGYRRTEFGPAWADVDRNGCDTRNDILRRDLTGITVRPGTHDCVILTGVLVDPYTDSRIDFRRGVATSILVQIDHVVALSDAWQKGAQTITATRREELANDPLNLLAVGGSVNEQKSDGDAATWLPPATSYRCDYVARQIAVKSKYGMWVTQAEGEAMARVLATCPGQRLPVG